MYPKPSRKRFIEKWVPRSGSLFLNSSNIDAIGFKMKQHIWDEDINLEIYLKCLYNRRMYLAVIIVIYTLT